jgi:DNA polymerase-3 subunit delta
MLNKALLREFENGLPNPIYYLWSEEGCFLDEAVSRIIETVLAGGAADFNYDAFYSPVPPQEILNAASTLPLMVPRRLVLIRDFHLFPASSVKALIPYFREPAETTCMVVLSLKAPAAKLDIDWKVYSLSIQERDIPAWLKQTAAKKGIKLTDEAVDYLIEYIGYEIGPLLMEIEKLASRGSGRISGRDIIASTSMMREYTTFELIDSLVAGQRSKAFRILTALLSTMSSHELPLILGTLNWHYKQFYSLWAHKGKRPVKMRERTYRTLLKYLPSFREEDFFRIFRSLHEADLGLKTSGRPELVLEVLFIRLLQERSVN